MDILLLEWEKEAGLGQAEDNEFGEISGPFIHYMNGELVELIGSEWPGNRERLTCARVMRSQFFRRFNLVSKVKGIARLTDIFFASG